MVQTAKVALVGAGRMGELHCANLAANPRLDLLVVADHNASLAEALARTNGARTATIEAVLADPDIAGVVVATSTDSLLPVTLACLAAGKAVFSEKPLSLSREALEKAATQIGSSAPPLFVAFNRRFDGHLAKMKARLEAGDIGDLETLHLINHDPAPPSIEFVPRSGGLFRDFTVHDFDTAAWLLDESIVELFAWASCLIDPAIAALGDVDTAKLLLTSSSGKICVISNSRRTGYGYDQRAEAFGSRGALRMENVQESPVVRWDGGGPRGDPIPFAFPQRYAAAYRSEINHFADILLCGAPPQTGLPEALRALRLAEAAEESIRTGRPVAINVGDSHHA